MVTAVARVTVVTWVQSLAQEHLNAVGKAKKKKKKKEEEEEKEKEKRNTLCEISNT